MTEQDARRCASHGPDSMTTLNAGAAATGGSRPRGSIHAATDVTGFEPGRAPARDAARERRSRRGARPPSALIALPGARGARRRRVPSRVVPAATGIVAARRWHCRRPDGTVSDALTWLACGAQRQSGGLLFAALPESDAPALVSLLRRREACRAGVGHRDPDRGGRTWQTSSTAAPRPMRVKPLRETLDLTARCPCLRVGRDEPLDLTRLVRPLPARPRTRPQVGDDHRGASTASAWSSRASIDAGQPHPGHIDLPVERPWGRVSDRGAAASGSSAIAGHGCAGHDHGPVRKRRSSASAAKCIARSGALA